MIKVLTGGIVDVFRNILFPFNSFDNQKIKEFNDSVEHLNRVRRNLDMRLSALHLGKES